MKMPGSNDEPRELRSMLRSFHMDHIDFNDYMPRDPVIGSRLSPGLEGTTGPRGFKRPYNRWGEDKLDGFKDHMASAKRPIGSLKENHW
jgi:hypothetical protein